MQHVGCQIAVRWLCTHCSCVSGPITARHSHAIVTYKQRSMKRSDMALTRDSVPRVLVPDPCERGNLTGLRPAQRVPPGHDLAVGLGT
jgi:hypothetical protein